MRLGWPFRKAPAPVPEPDGVVRPPVPPRDPDRPLGWVNGLPVSDLAPFGGSRAASVEQVLASLASAARERGLLLDGDAIEAVAGHARDGTLPEFREPWMSTWKLPAARAIALAREVVDRAVRAFGMDALYEAGLPLEWTERPGKFEMAAFQGDRVFLLMLSSVLAKVPMPGAATFSATVDYVLACLGDRASMERTNVRLSEKLARWSAGPTPPELVVVADTWRRFACCSSGGDWSEDMFRLRFSAASFSLCDPPASAFVDGVSYPAVSDAALEAREAMYRNAAEAGDYRILARRRRKETASEVQDGSGNRSSGAEAWETGMSVTVLSGIGGSADEEATVQYKPLLGPVQATPPPDPDGLYEALSREFPWMDGPNRAAALAAATSARVGGCFRLRPLLLVGPAGCGKSRWTRRMAALSGARFHAESMSGANNSVSVVGTERGWKSARPSLPVIAMSQCACANPVLLADEVDKTQSGANGNLLDGLLPLLEKETAMRYMDRFLLGAVDASNVSWVLTANSVASLPQPLLDRVQVLRIERPARRHWKSAANSLTLEAASAAGFTEDDPVTGDARAAAYEVLSSGGSLRSAASAAAEVFEKVTWSPKPRLEIVSEALLPRSP